MPAQTTPAPAPVFTPPPVDPSVAAATNAANLQSLAGLQQEAQLDSASILARYGQQLATAGAFGGSPLAGR